SKEINSQVPHDFTDLLKAKTEIISHHDEFKKELPKVPAAKQGNKRDSSAGHSSTKCKNPSLYKKSRKKPKAG
ncbi:MAG: hypothetical protein ACTSWC_07650, partial [Promethearchaeota archaeon]